MYLAERYYLHDQETLPFRKAVLVTATAVARWSTHYVARLLAPRSKQTAPTHKSGALPAATAEKEAFVAELVSWLFENSVIDELFTLRLDDRPVLQPGRTAKFDHHDDSGSWVLNLSESEFAKLQAEWKDHDLPEDLFYPEENTLCIPYPGEGLKARILRSLGVEKCYTPRQWEIEVGKEVTLKHRKGGV